MKRQHFQEDGHHGGSQWLHSLERQLSFVTNRVAGILEITTVDEWNYVKSRDNTADAGTHGLSTNSLRDSPWLKVPSFLLTPDWTFKPLKEVDIKLKAQMSDTSKSEQETFQFTTALGATVFGVATTFVWQKYSSYEKVLRVVAYSLRLLPKNEGYRSDCGQINDPNELRNYQMRLFYLIQQESFPIETKCLLRQSPVSNSS